MKNFKVGIQLFGVRDEMVKDMDAALAKIKAIGYDYVELAGYYGKSADEVKALLDKHGLIAISAHQGPQDFWRGGQAPIDDLKTIGVKYCAIPWYGVAEFKERFDETMEKFTSLGKVLKENGIQLLYHNHDFEFQKIDGEYIIDKIYKSVPAELLQPEFDTCWVNYAGEDPAKFLAKYSDRKIDVVHLKDFVCKGFVKGPVYGLIGEGGNEGDNSGESEFKFKPCGYGVQNFSAILDSCEKIGAEYLIVEQDQWYDEDPFDCAKKSREYLKDTFNI